MGVYFLFSFFFSLLPFFVRASIYGIIPRRATTEGRTPSDIDQLISFDGDLDTIKKLALARAKGSGVSPTIPTSPSASPSSHPLASPSITPGESGSFDSFKCKDAEIGHLEILTFKYSIETTRESNITTIIGEVEEILLEAIAPFTLSCRNETNALAGIVAMDSVIPADSPSRDETCLPVLDPSNNCTVVDGRMRLFLSSRDTVESAIQLSLDQIKIALKNEEFVLKVETGLKKIDFISNADEEEVPVSNIQSSGDVTTAETGLSTTSSALVGLGSALILALAGAVYYIRHARTKDLNGTMMQDTGSSFAQPISPSDPDRPTSPFSEMLPGAYRMGDLDKMSMLSTSNMSPVYEDDDGSHSVDVSESGYTTEAAGTYSGEDSSLGHSKRTMYSTPDMYGTPDGEKGYLSAGSLEFLGARPRDGAPVMSDLEMSDSETDAASDVSSQASPLKLYATNSLLLPDGDQDEPLQNEDILLFEKPKNEAGTVNDSLVDISLSEP